LGSRPVGRGRAGARPGAGGGDLLPDPGGAEPLVAAPVSARADGTPLARPDLRAQRLAIRGPVRRNRYGPPCIAEPWIFYRAGALALDDRPFPSLRTSADPP